MDFQEHALPCREENPDLFFPVGTSGAALVQAEQAKTVCRACPVAEQCLAWALATGQDFGVWGGATEQERRSLRRAAGAGQRGGARDGRSPAGSDAGCDPTELPAGATRAERQGAGVAAVERGATREQVAASLKVSVRTIDRWLAHHRQVTQAAATRPTGTEATTTRAVAA